MKKLDKHGQHLEQIAKSALSVFATVAASAKSSLSRFAERSMGAVGVVNTWTDQKLMEAQKRRDAESHKDLVTLSEEPAIARIVVVNEDGRSDTYFVCRASPSDAALGAGQLVSYRSPIGRLASLPVGSDLELKLPRGIVSVEVTERGVFRPKMVDRDWDSVNSILQGREYGPITVVSLRGLLGRIVPEDDSSLLESLLAEEQKSKNILDGIRRSVITKMGLRDQPILDQYQDAIFRLPLNSRLMIVGPPGSGKTTTLVRRLGQKLDRTFLEGDESVLIERAQHDDALTHEESWTMFSPTELLKQYVKEAFAREGIAASDQRIRTWSDFRRELARNTLGVLRTAAGGGSFVMKEALSVIKPDTIAQQIKWFDDFRTWHISAFWNDLVASARILRDDPISEVARLGARLAAVVESGAAKSTAAELASISAEADAIRDLFQSKKADTDARIRGALNLAVNRDRGFLDELAKFVGGLSSISDEPDDQELEDEDEALVPTIGREAAVSAFMRTVRAHARADAGKRSLGGTSRSAMIAEWLGERSLAKEERLAVGKSLQMQDAARRFLNPTRRYIDGIPGRYRRFRRVRQSEGRWYGSERHSPSDITPLEVDVVLLAMLRAANELFREPRIQQRIGDQGYTSLRRIRDLYRNQVVVDEATDFSPIQLSCMSYLSHPQIRSFFACGDFNQRITEWGSRSVEELKWVLPDIEIKSIEVTYRHSRQLNELARNIVRAIGGAESHAVLPENVNSEGVAPALAKGLRRNSEIANWLAKRIEEIEQFTQTLPSIAILVNGEAEVRPIADSLNEALLVQNIRVVPCPDGQVMGQENDVRVFDIQHIKGLEFEAVFFVGVDQLAERLPQLFDKYLYVGATRAATYLGITCAGLELPNQIATLESTFVGDWKMRPPPAKVQAHH